MSVTIRSMDVGSQSQKQGLSDGDHRSQERLAAENRRLRHQILALRQQVDRWEQKVGGQISSQLHEAYQQRERPVGGPPQGQHKRHCCKHCGQHAVQRVPTIYKAICRCWSCHELWTE